MLLCISKRLLSLGSCGSLSIFGIPTAIQEHVNVPILSAINERLQSPERRPYDERMLFQIKASNSMTFPKRKHSFSMRGCIHNCLPRKMGFRGKTLLRYYKIFSTS